MKESTMDSKKWYSEPLTRRQALKDLGGLTGAGFLFGTGAYGVHQQFATKVGLAPTPTISPTATDTGDATSIQHVLIACQENRTFDTYFGMYPKAGSYGIPPNYTQPGETARVEFTDGLSSRQSISSLPQRVLLIMTFW